MALSLPNAALALAMQALSIVSVNRIRQGDPKVDKLGHSIHLLVASHDLRFSVWFAWNWLAHDFSLCGDCQAEVGTCISEEAQAKTACLLKL